MVGRLSHDAGENCRACRQMETSDLEKDQAAGCEDRMFEVDGKQGEKHEGLGNREKIARQQAVKDDLSLRKGTREQEFNIRRLKDQSTLQKTLEERAAQHD